MVSHHFLAPISGVATSHCSYSMSNCYLCLQTLVLPFIWFVDPIILYTYYISGIYVHDPILSTPQSFLPLPNFTTTLVTTCMCYSVIYPLPFNQTPIDNYQAWSTGVKTGTPQSNATRNSTLIQAQNLKNSIKSCKMIQIHSNFQLRRQVFPKNIHPPRPPTAASPQTAAAARPGRPCPRCPRSRRSRGPPRRKRCSGRVPWRCSVATGPGGHPVRRWLAVRFPSGYLVS